MHQCNSQQVGSFYPCFFKFSAIEPMSNCNGNSEQQENTTQLQGQLGHHFLSASMQGNWRIYPWRPECANDSKESCSDDHHGNLVQLKNKSEYESMVKAMPNIWGERYLPVIRVKMHTDGSFLIDIARTAVINAQIQITTMIFFTFLVVTRRLKGRTTQLWRSNTNSHRFRALTTQTYPEGKPTLQNTSATEKSWIWKQLTAVLISISICVLNNAEKFPITARLPTK